MKRVSLMLGAIVLIVILALLIGPLLYPVLILTGTLPEHELADSDSRFMDVKGNSVHFKEMGQGEPVFVLLHGFGASTYSWREVMEPLSKEGRVIAYDRPSFGLTSRPMPGDWTGKNPYSVQGNVELLDGLMNQFGVEKVILVGNSAGGGVEAAYAIAYPERVQGLVLVDPAIGNGHGGRFPSWILPILATPQMRHLGPLLVRSIAGDSGDETLKLAWRNPTLFNQQVYDGYRTPLQADNWDKARYEFTIAADPTVYLSRLTEIKIPVLIVSWDDDRNVSTDSSIHLSNEIPGATLVIFNNCGHVPQEECPNQFMDALKGFLEEVK